MIPKGLKIFPCAINGKEPALTGDWASHTTTDEDKIQGWIKNRYNLGVDCGASGLCVIDVDNKNGKNGSESLLKAELMFGELPDTYTVKTPTGGFHYYFYGLTRNRVDMFPGVDVRSWGGYVLAEKSCIDSRYYDPQSKPQIAKLPEWLKLKIGEKSDAEKQGKEKVIESLDTAENIMRAIRFASKQAKPAIEGEGGDHTTFTVVARLADMGISKDTCLEILQDHYNPRCEPPWDDADLETKVKNAYAYRTNPIGVDTQEHRINEAKSIFKPIDNEVLDVKAIPLSCKRKTEREIPKREWVLGYRLIKRYVSLLIAPGGVGKSTISILDALSIASGKNLTGDEPKISGPVWIHNAEDPSDEMEMRLLGAAKYHGIDFNSIHPIYITSGRDLPITLMGTQGGVSAVNTEAVDQIIKTIIEKKIVLLSLDPLVRLHECNENDNQAMDCFSKIVTRIADRAKCSVCLVHHSRKLNASSGAGSQDTARGASAVVSAARIAHTISTMDEKEAKQYGISLERRKWFVRLDDAKLNLAPPANEIRWMQRRSVVLDNGESIGTLEPLKLEKVETDSQLYTYLDSMAEMPQGTFPMLSHVRDVAAKIKDDRDPKVICQWIRRNIDKYNSSGEGVMIRDKRIGYAMVGKRYSFTVVLA
jgi:RecA-family ATPase